MKINNKSLYLGLGAILSLTACNDLDTTLMTSEVTSQQKEEVLEMDPDKALSSVNAIATGVYTVPSDDAHYNFGMPSMMMMFDSQGQDFISANSGYNWFLNMLAINVGTNTSQETSVVWTTMYNSIYSENEVLASIPEETEDETFMFYRAQSLCFRAFDYWVLSQVYQHNYYGNEDKPCVPVITEKNQEEAAIYGIPRSTVAATYEQILSDLNEAVELLSKTSVTAQKVIAVKPKRFFNLDAAYGMLARVYLTMHDYANAQKAAENCLAVTSCRPYTISEVNHPTFISLDDSSWLWGQAVAETDQPVLTGIVNFPSMMGTFNYGYCQYGAWRWINKNLFDYIPSTDVRKGWWLNDNFESPNLTQAYYDYMNDYGFTANVDITNEDSNFSAIVARTQVKFAPYNYQINTTTNASDIPYFRIEEVYYILYEAMAMNGNPGGALSGLQNFVRTYRNPYYTFSSTDAEAIQDEIWMQRRVEFWGEGFVAWFDLKRLGKPIDRVGAGYPSVFVYQIPAGSQEFVLPIPQQETQTNKQLPESDNNPSWTRPQPVTGGN